MHRNSLTRTGRWLASLLVAAGAILTGFVSPVWAAQGGMLGIKPADETSYFHVKLLPGKQTRRTAIVSNLSGQAEKVAIYPADGHNTPQGGFAVRKQTDPRVEIAAWTQLPVKELLLAPGTDRRVSFQIAVPIGTPPGDYSGGIVVQSQERQGKTSQVNKGTAVQINIVERVAARIYLRVPGTSRPAITLGALTSTDTENGRTFQLVLTNKGNIRLQPRTTLRITGWRTSTSLTFSAVDTLLPGQQAVLQATWDAPPRVFWGKATAVVRSEAGTAQASTAVRIIPILLAALALAVLATVCLGLVLGLRWVRRARRALRSSRENDTSS